MKLETPQARLPFSRMQSSLKGRNIAAGASAVDLKRGLDRGSRVAVEALRGISRPVGNRKERAQVATISAHNDSSIGELVADAVEKVGQEGVISVAGSSRLTSSPIRKSWRQ